ncbi:MAG: hypothetical protein JNG88_17285 [Phycisphaerales bacterium]|nr:hypothetical protein [Phycisphaerales bacterium]
MKSTAQVARTFDQDVAFMRKHTDVIVLRGADGASVAVTPTWQGRVMTSAISGDGEGFGWINDELIQSGETREHINPYGGEDRFWMGPEGGQFAIFFKKGDPFDLTHWQTPACIDTAAWRATSQNEREVTFRHEAKLVNYSGEVLETRIDRTVRLVSPADAAQALGVALGPGVRGVGFESENRLTNAGTRPWTKDAGLLSIWILGMFKHSPETTVIAPYHPGPIDQLGPVVNDAYFGKVPADRLRIEGGVVLFRGDGQCRSKIGLSPQRSKPVVGSYDAARNVLTIVQYSRPPGARDYVNSMWQMQDNPYGGDVVNSYNDGPPSPGAKPLGPFYELETSSPAAMLAPGAALIHTHRTIHFTGPVDQLDAICRKVLGVELAKARW